MERSNSLKPEKTDSELSNDAFIEKYIDEVAEALSKEERTEDNLELLEGVCKRLCDLDFLLEGMSQEKLHGFLRAITIRKVPCGQFVVREGEVCSSVSIVIDGYVGLYQKSKEDAQKENFLKPCYRGAMFSELDMMHERNSTVSGFVKVDAILISLDQQGFNEYLREPVTKHTTELYDFIHKSIPKSRTQIPNSEIEGKYYYFERKTLQKDELLAQEGKVAEYMYYLISGEVKLYLPSKAYKTLMVGPAIGKEMATIHKSGSCLTDESALQKEALAYSIRVSSETAEVYRVHQTIFLSKMPAECLNAIRSDLVNKKRLRKQQIEKAKHAKPSDSISKHPGISSELANRQGGGALPIGAAPILIGVKPPTEKKVGEENAKEPSSDTSASSTTPVKKDSGGDKYQANLARFQIAIGGDSRNLGSRFGAAKNSDNSGGGMDKTRQAALLKLRNQGLGLRNTCHQMADETAEVASFDVTKFAHFRKLEKKNREGVAPGGKTDIISKLHAFSRHDPATGGGSAAKSSGSEKGAQGFFRGLPTE